MNSADPHTAARPGRLFKKSVVMSKATGQVEVVVAADTTSAQYGAVLDDVADRYGVRVAPAPKSDPNPYAMTAKKARSLAEKAGILTKAGNLTKAYR